MKKIAVFSLFLLFCIQTAAFSENIVRAYYFHSPDCAKCVVIKRFIPKLQKKYPLEVKSFNVNDIKNYEKFILLEKQYKVSGGKIPALFIGDSVLIGSNEIRNKLEAKIKTLLAQGGSSWPEIQVGEGEAIIERFKSFKLLAVLSAGLIDGVNPCAFATLVFFISFLSFVGRRRREILLTGIFFTAAVFFTYLLIGLGAFNFLRTTQSFFWLSRTIYYGVGILAIILGFLSLYDYYKFKTGKTAEMALQLPRGIKKIIHAVIRENITASGLITAAIVTGFLVSLLESICTGQVYLPTIVFILKTPGMQAQAFTYLLLYNLMFILPLVLIFGLTIFGATSEWLGKFMNQHLGTIKILTAFLFFGLAFLLLVM
jgi:thiol-disulfide isomerase/thioredoxin